MFPQVFRRVCGSNARGAAATLANYARYRLRGRSYPGIVRQSGAHVEGVLYEGISGAQLQRLDAFEGWPYRRVRVRVHDRRGRSVSAWTYVIPERHRALLGRGGWDAGRFSRHHLARFLAAES